MTKYWPDQGKRVFGKLWGDFNNPRRRSESHEVAAIFILFINEVKHLTTQAQRIFCVILLHFYQPNHSGDLKAFEYVKCRIAGKYRSILVNRLTVRVLTRLPLFHSATSLTG